MACAGVLAWGAAAQAATVTVTTLHSFTGVNGQPATGGEPEKTGEGAAPHAPPVFDPASGRIVGATERGGYMVNLGVVYALDPAAGAAPDPRMANARAVSVNSPQITTDGQGTFYQGATYDIYKFMPGDLLPVAAVPQNNPKAGAQGLWAFGTAGAAAPSLYMLRNWAGGDYATRLHRYTPSTGDMVELHAWAMNPSLYSSDFQPAAVVVGTDGAVYGLLNSYYRHPAVDAAGALPKPQIFRAEPDGSGHETIMEFSDAVGAGYPVATSNTPAARSSLVDGGDGWLYGSTYAMEPAPAGQLPATARGTVYRVSKTQKDTATGYNQVEILHTFAGGTADGEGAHGPLVRAGDGSVYGTTRAGGANGAGTLWRVVLAAGAPPAYELLHSFTEAVDGKGPVGLSASADGFTLYGAAQSGGAANTGADTSGTVFRVDLPRPVLSIDSFTADGGASASVADGAKVALAWASTNTTRCEAGGDWSGTKQASGSEETPALAYREGGYSFTLVCGDDAGGRTGQKTVSVQVARPGVTPPTEPPTEPPAEPTDPTAPPVFTPLPSGGGGGGGPLSPMVLLALAALVPLLRGASRACRTQQSRQ